MKQLIGIFAALVIPAATLACSSAPRSSRAENCLLTSNDSAYLAGGAVYRDCAVDVRARVVGTRRAPDFRPSAPPTPGTECYLAEVEFVVNTSGVPEMNTARIVRSTDMQYALQVLAVLPEWRYSPAQKDGTPVRQVVRERSAMATVVTVVRSGGSPPPPSRAPNCPR